MNYRKLQINWDFLILFIMSVLNLLFVHHYFLQTIDLEVECFKSSLFDNLIACLLDVTVIYFISLLITLRRVRASLAITFTITLIWSFANAFYARFFHQYLNWSSMGQAGNLSDTSVINSMLAEFHTVDLFYPAMAILFFWLFIRSRKNDITKKSLKTVILTWLICATLGVFAHALYIFHPHYGVVHSLDMTMFTSEKMDSMWPNWTVFHKGFFRKLVVDQLTRKKEIKLTKEQIEEIEKAYSDHSQRVTKRTAPDSIKNVIFILVESYLSVTSDLVVDGKEITPNMNRLKHDSTVYYNGHMRPNVSIGESADGQFIYMAGLLPLHSEITVSKAKRDTIIGLPEQMKKIYPDLKSYTLIPTNPTLWEQQPMTEAYGADVVSMFDGLTAFLKANESLITDMSVPMYLVNLAFRLFLCLFGNNLYYRFVLKHVSKIRQNAPTDHIRKALLDSEGGTSIWNILGCCGIYYGAVFGLYMVLMLMFI